MRLQELMGQGGDVEISALALDTARVAPGALFFCVPGFTRDGHDFAAEAIARGAVALVVERTLDAGVPEVVVPSVRAAMAPIAARFHGDPTARIAVVGVTGTNGKTTTAYLVRALLEAAGRQCGLLGTVKSVIGGVEHEVVRTTPEAVDLQRDFAAMAAGGDLACAIEVSSHALVLHRADAIHFAAAIFTNLTQDHLDFHADMEDYFAAKRRLFTDLAPAVSVINVDDPYGRRLAGEVAGAITFGIDSADADYRAGEPDYGMRGSRFTVRTPEDEVELSSPLPGRFNVLNVLGAVAAARALGVEQPALVQAVAGAGRVPGRFEPVDEGQDFALLVDYAHTPDSLENVLRAARPLTRGRLIVVFGAGGDRDRSKRPLMGRVAVALADRVIVTSDNPRSEDPDSIVREILAGTGDGAESEVDRRAAIHAAVAGARAGDVVVLAGKGHEQGQELAGGHKIPFDDVSVAREALRAQAVAGT